MIAMFVRLMVKLDTDDECIRLCREMTEESRKEPGCVQYVVHQSRENPHCFAFYEQYVDEAALKAHWDSPHYARFILGGVDKLVESRTRETFVPLS